MVVSSSATTGSTVERMSKSGAGIVTYVLKGEVHQGDNDAAVLGRHTNGAPCP